MDLPLVFVVKLVWNVVGRSEKYWILKTMSMVSQSGGNEIAGA